MQGSILSQTRNLAERWQLGGSLTEMRRKQSLWLGMAQGFLPQENICKTLCHLVSAGGKQPCRSQSRDGADTGALCFATLHSPWLGMLLCTEMLLSCILPGPAESSRAEHQGKWG